MMRPILAALLLAGCAAQTPRVQTVEVRVPVPTPCLTRVPAPPDALPPMPADANAALAIALGSLMDWKAYGIEADGVMHACATVHP